MIEKLLPEFSSLNTAWVLIAAFLVFLMLAGFAMREAGFTRAKNIVNIIMKNLLSVSAGTLAFYAIGFGLMFAEGNYYWGTGFFGLEGIPDLWGDIPTLAFFLFQAMFAVIAALIVSGAVAGRTKFAAYIIFAIVLTAFTYPMIGHWIWGEGGWLGARGFTDFAGSTVVHSVGGWAALAGIIVVGSRVGRFKKDYDKKRFSAHSLPLAALGVFILWFAWFGFNAGSQLAIEGMDNAKAVALIATNTHLAASAGALAALIMGWYMTKMAKAGFVLNGALAGLVAITAPVASVTPSSAVWIGVFGAVVMMLVAKLLELVKLDDAVGAVPVHLGAGIWGTLAVGLFASDGGLFYGGGGSLLWTQAVGIFWVGLFVFGVSWVIFKVLARSVGVRAGEEEEREGLDLKHGQAAYPDF